MAFGKQCSIHSVVLFGPYSRYWLFEINLVLKTNYPQEGKTWKPRPGFQEGYLFRVKIALIQNVCPIKESFLFNVLPYILQNFESLLLIWLFVLG